MANLAAESVHGTAPHSYKDMARVSHQQSRRAHWDTLARGMETWSGWGGYYHRRLTQVYKFLVPPGQRVLEIGCAQGDLLAALEPAVGVGVDFSWEMLRRAAQRYPRLRFVQADAHAIGLNGTFDVIILSDLLNDLWDVQTVLQEVARLSTPRTRLIINSYSRLWELPLALAERLGLAHPTLHQNWLTVEDIANLLYLTDFEIIRSWPEVLLPLPIPAISTLCNRILVKLWPFSQLALTNLIVARPKSGAGIQPKCSPPCKDEPPANPSVSVVIPARNEAGNIPHIFTRLPRMGRETELVFVEGHSRDDTYAAIEREAARHPEWKCKLLKQVGIGKGDAVRQGFAHADGDILMILDADLTVPPEDLPRFYEALRTGRGEFINGVRLVYPMEAESMRLINFLGNKFFSLAFSWLLGQSVKDTLCGTKALWKKDYEVIAANRAYFGDFDPFGDFDLLFGAAKQNLKILDLPIRYRERTYGTTNIHRWKHGWLLLRMVLFAAGRIKFV